MSADQTQTPGLDAEYRVLREGCGVHGPLQRQLLAFVGPEAGEYLQGQVTNDVLEIGPGQGCYAALLDRKGKMQGDMRIIRTEQERYEVDRTGEAHGPIARHLQMYMIGREVSLEQDESTALIELRGPAAPALLGDRPLGPEHSRSEIRLDGIECALISTIEGFDLICPADRAEELVAFLRESGAEPVGPAALELLRVEQGIPAFGAEMGTDTIPQEAGINERAVSFTKGCYIGQETVARLHYKGKPNRHLRGLRLEQPAQEGDPVATADREVGRIATAVVSPAHGPIALAILRREAEPGDVVSVGEGLSAEVVDLPF